MKALTVKSNATGGSISVTGNLKTTGANATDSKITVQTAGTNATNDTITLNKAATGSDTQVLTTTGGDATVSSGAAVLSMQGDADVGGALALTTTTGAINIGTGTSAGYDVTGGSTSITSGTGAITAYGSINSDGASGDTVVQTQNAITLTKESAASTVLSSKNGNVTVKPFTSAGDYALEITGDITAGGNIDLETYSGDLTYNGAAKSVGALTVKSNATGGAISVTGNLKTTGDSATDSQITVQTAGTDATNDTITLTKAEGGSDDVLTTTAGNATVNSGAAALSMQGGATVGGALELTTSSGKITVGSDEVTPTLSSTGSTTTIHTTSGGAIEINGIAKSLNGTTVQTEGGSGNATITVNGGLETTGDDSKNAILVETAGDKISLTGTTATTAENQVLTTNKGNASVIAGGTGAIDIQGNAAVGGALQVNTASGDITIGSEQNKDFSVKGATTDISSSNGGTVTIYGKAGAEANTNINTSGDINITGVISTDATSKEKNITIITTGGNISLTKEEGNDYVINSAGGATITASYSGTASDNQGNIKLDGDVKAVDAVSITAATGDVDVDNVSSTNSSVAIQTTTGDITLNGTGSSKTGTSVSVLGAGDINVKGALNTASDDGTTGSVEVYTKTGSITLTKADVKENETAGPVIDSSGSASVSTGYTGTYVTEGSDTDKALGDITIEGDVTAADDASISTKVGDLTVTGNVNSVTGTTLETTKDGAIKVTGKLSTTAEQGEKAGAVSVSTTGDAITLTAAEADEDKNAIVSVGKVDVNADGGNVSVQGNVAGASNVGVQTAGAGTVSIGSGGNSYNVSSTSGTTGITTEKGGITLYGTTSSASGTTIQSTDGGAINVTGALKTTDIGGLVKATTSGAISLATADSTNAPDVVVSAGGVSITTTNKNDYDAASTDGNITISGNVKAANTTTISTETGDISVNGGLATSGTTANTSGINVSTTAGNITLSGGMSGTVGETEVSNLALNTAAGNASVVAGKDYDIALKGSSLVGGELELGTSGDGSIAVNKPVSSIMGL